MEYINDKRKLDFLKGGIAQTALVVKDLDQIVARYYNVFGIGPWHFYTYCRPFVPHMTYYGKPADYSMRLALSYFGTSRIELIEHVKGPSIYEDFVKRYGYGIQHLGFLVKNMEKALEKAKQAGFSMIMDGSGFGLDGDGHYAYLDSEKKLGFIIELIQRPKKKVDPEYIYPAP